MMVDMQGVLSERIGFLMIETLEEDNLPKTKLSE